MKIRLEIISLENNGDAISVKGQGFTKKQAEWRPMQKWSFTVPEYIGKHYRIGQIIHIEVKP